MPWRTLLVLALAALAGCSPSRPDDSRYLDEIRMVRAAKDAAFSRGDSPVPPDKRSTLLPLAYFPIDPAYSVPARFDEAPAGKRMQLEMETSSHQPRKMERVGVLRFMLKGQALQLGAFVEEGQSDDRLFVPFADATSGKETYPGGRYLEIPRSPTGVYLVDFNRAFNPYCYYNPTYDCPYPPKENRLPVAVEAGEKIRSK